MRRLSEPSIYHLEPNYQDSELGGPIFCSSRAPLTTQAIYLKATQLLSRDFYLVTYSPCCATSTMSMLGTTVRRLAFKAPSKFFVCNQCLRPVTRTKPSSILNLARSRGFADHAATQTTTASQAAAKPAAQAFETAKKEFPKTTSKAVAYWLIGSAASCFGIVVWGGLTRLTESG